MYRIVSFAALSLLAAGTAYPQDQTITYDQMNQIGIYYVAAPRPEVPDVLKDIRIPAAIDMFFGTGAPPQIGVNADAPVAPPKDVAILEAMRILLQKAAGQDASETDLREQLLEAGLSETEAADLGGEADDPAGRAAIVQKLLEKVAAIGPGEAPGNLTTLDEIKRAASTMAEMAAERERKLQEAALKMQELERQRRFLDLLITNPIAGAIVAAETGYPQPRPPSIWPAWMGQNRAYAPIYAQALSVGSSGYFAHYEGEARGSDGLGNDVEGAFLAFFEDDGGAVDLQGALLGLEFFGTIADPAVNGFTADIYGGTTDVTAGASQYYPDGVLSGSFYGANHQTVGGIFTLNGGGGNPDVVGHFAGVGQ